MIKDSPSSDVFVYGPRGKPTNAPMMEDLLSNPADETAEGKHQRLLAVSKDLSITYEDAERFFG